MNATTERVLGMKQTGDRNLCPHCHQPLPKNTTSERLSEYERDFKQFWRSYPKRKGGNPKHPARLKFENAVNDAISAADIIAAAERYAEEIKAEKKENTCYVAQAVTWLNQRRWEDYSMKPNQTSSVGIQIHPSDEAYQKWYSFYVQTGKTAMVRVLDQRKLENRPFLFDALEPPSPLESVLNAG